MNLFEHKPIYGAAALALAGAAVSIQAILNEFDRELDDAPIEFIVERPRATQETASQGSKASEATEPLTPSCLVAQIPARTQKTLRFSIPEEIYTSLAKQGPRLVANQAAIDSAVDAIRSNIKIVPGSQTEGWTTSRLASDFTAKAGILSVWLNNNSPVDEHASICGPAQAKLSDSPALRL